MQSGGNIHPMAAGWRVDLVLTCRVRLARIGGQSGEPQIHLERRSKLHAIPSGPPMTTSWFRPKKSLDSHLKVSVGRRRIAR